VAAQLVASRVVLGSTELVSGGRSVGIFRLRTKGHGAFLFLCVVPGGFYIPKNDILYSHRGDDLRSNAYRN
jgi:hypothetical protein